MQTTRLRAGLLAALLLMSLSPASAEPEAGTPEPAANPVPNDVLLVLDNSGSMKKNDPKFLMREVVSSFARQLPGDARLGLVLFDEKVHLVLGLTAADAPDFQQKVEAALKRIDYRGKRTDIPAGVERAIYELRQQGRPEAERILIFLTDGIVDLGSEARNIEQAQWLRGSLAEQAKSLGIPIFGIAFTEEADFQLIQSVVQTTGGEYYRVLAAPDIQTTFDQIRARMEAMAEADTPPVEPEAAPVSEPPVAQAPAPVPAEPRAAPIPPAEPEPESPWDSTPPEWRPWLIIALGLSVLGVIGVVAIARSREAKPLVSVPKAMLYDLGSHTEQLEYVLEAVTKIGRDENNNNIAIPFDTVSGYHAEIRFRDGQFYLCDLKSSNKTFLDGQALTPDQQVLLKHGSRIRFDAYEFEFVREDRKHLKKTVVQGAEAPKRTVARGQPPEGAPPKPVETPAPQPVREQPLVHPVGAKTKVKGKCPKHPLWDASELCPNCKEARCPYCMEEKGGRRLCKGCWHSLSLTA